MRGLAAALALLAMAGGAWAQARQRTLAAPDPLATKGEQVFRDQGCYGCHTVGAFGTPIGPDLSHVGARYSRGELVRWLRDPQAQRPAHMPRLDLTEDEIQAVARFLAALE